MGTRVWQWASAAVLAAGLAGAVSAQVEPSLEPLQGEWQAVEGVDAGEKIAHADLKNLKWIIQKDGITVDDLGYISRGTIKVDNTKNPRHFDLTIDGGTTLGLYRLEGDRLIVVLDNGEKGRPKDFHAKAGTEDTLVVFKRVPGAAGLRRAEVKKTK